MEIQETQNTQNYLEKEEQIWRTHTSQFQNFLSYSNQGYDNDIRRDIQISEIELRVQK